MNRMKNETQLDDGYKDLMRLVAWPAPPQDLHDRIMLSLDARGMPFWQGGLSVPRLTFFSALAFSCAFALGMLETYTIEKPAGDLYAQSLYYGGANEELYKMLGS